MHAHARPWTTTDADFERIDDIFFDFTGMKL
jgi:hypothetical protein